MLGLILVLHLAHLEGDGFQPGLSSLNSPNHGSEPIRRKKDGVSETTVAKRNQGHELVADNWLLHQRLPEDHTLVGPPIQHPLSGQSVVATNT